MSAPTIIISSVEPLEKRPCHSGHASARGLSEPFENVYVLRGFCTEGHIHAPIIYQGRYFKPFTTHKDDKVHTCAVQVILDDPKNPFKSGDVAKYPGIVKMYENVSRIKRPSSNSPKGRLWILRTLVITTYEPVSKTESTETIENVLAWRSGSDPAQKQPSKTVPFCVKAIELSAKEIQAHKSFVKQSERIPL